MCYVIYPFSTNRCGYFYDTWLSQVHSVHPHALYLVLLVLSLVLMDARSSLWSVIISPPGGAPSPHPPPALPEDSLPPLCLRIHFRMISELALVYSQSLTGITAHWSNTSESWHFPMSGPRRWSSQYPHPCHSVAFPRISQSEVLYILSEVIVTWQTTPYFLGFHVFYLTFASQFPFTVYYYWYT